MEAIGTGRDDEFDYSRKAPHLWINDTYIFDQQPQRASAKGLTIVQLNSSSECTVEVIQEIN